jgi:peptide/nickel transport system permease protein
VSPSESPPDEESPFETVSDVQLSQRERYAQAVDEFVVAPFRILWDDWRARFGLGVVVLYLLMGTVGIHVVAEPATNQVERLVPAFHAGWIGIGSVQVLGWAIPWPELTAPLGSDASGRDLLSLMVHATPDMLLMIMAGAVFSVVVATVVGTTAGYRGGLIDRILMTFNDVALTIPGLPLIIILGFALKPRDPILVGLILGIDNWPGLSRALRSEVLSIREKSYVEAQRAMGIGYGSILRRDIVPQLTPYISINFMKSAKRVIFESVALYFLGVLPYTTVNWGVVLQSAYSSPAVLYNLDMLHWLVVPMITIALLSLGLILLSQGLDRVFNPRIRARHAKTTPDVSSEAMGD